MMLGEEYLSFFKKISDTLKKEEFFWIGIPNLTMMEKVYKRFVNEVSVEALEKHRFSPLPLDDVSVAIVEIVRDLEPKDKIALSIEVLYQLIPFEISLSKTEEGIEIIKGFREMTFGRGKYFWHFHPVFSPLSPEDILKMSERVPKEVLEKIREKITEPKFVSSTDILGITHISTTVSMDVAEKYRNYYHEITKEVKVMPLYPILLAVKEIVPKKMFLNTFIKTDEKRLTPTMAGEVYLPKDTALQVYRSLIDFLNDNGATSEIITDKPEIRKLKHRDMFEIIKRIANSFS